MTKNELVSLHKSSSPLDYSTQTPFVSFILLCALNDPDLIHSWGTLTLTDIYHASIMKSSVSPTPKRGEITGPSDLINMLAYMGNLIPRDPYIGSIGSKTRRCMETHTGKSRQSHFMRVT